MEGCREGIRSNGSTQRSYRAIDSNHSSLSILQDPRRIEWWACGREEILVKVGKKSYGYIWVGIHHWPFEFWQNVVDILARYVPSFYHWVALTDPNLALHFKPKISLMYLSKHHQYYFIASHSKEVSYCVPSPPNVNWKHLGVLKMYTFCKILRWQNAAVIYLIFPKGILLVKVLGTQPYPNELKAKESFIRFFLKGK